MSSLRIALACVCRPAFLAISLLAIPSLGTAQSYSISTAAGGGNSSGPFPAPATSVYLDDPIGMATDSSGNLYFADGQDNVVYKVSGGTISIVAGNGKSGYSGDGGPATSAALYAPYGVALDTAGNLYIVDSGNYVVREVSGGVIRTIAGNGSDGIPVAGPAANSPMYRPSGVAVDASGNVYISCSDGGGGYILKVANGSLSIIAGNGTLP